MSADSQLTLLNTVSDEAIKQQCCHKNTDESSTVTCSNSSHITHPKQLRCKNGIKSNLYNTPCSFRQRQISQDSGLSISSLDPIAEDRCCHCQHDDAGLVLRQDPAIDEQSLTPVKQTACKCCCDQKEEIPRQEIVNNSANVGCNCASGLNRPNEQVIVNRCEHVQETPTYATRVYSSKASLVPVEQKYERIRNNSGSLRDSLTSDEGLTFQKIAFNKNYSASDQDQLIHINHTETLRPEKNENEDFKLKRGKRSCRKILLIIAGLVILCLIISAVYAIFSFRSNMKIMEEKIEQLEQEMSKSSTGTFSMLRSNLPEPPMSSTRPYVHFTLRAESNIPMTPWKHRVLQWVPVVYQGESNGDKALEYNSQKRSLIVHESGTYFVYNQIYVYRHVSESTGALNKVANQTLFHAIFNRPFNYPSNKKPITISESTLSSCWNENADTQIHTSYQGIIVNLQTNDELLVALEDYNASLDTLDPKSTFFGVFKL